MKTILGFLSFVLIASVQAQNFSGQWKGAFIDNSTKFMGWGGDRCEYVLELECANKEVKGFSYTYFSEAGRRYYTICRLEGFINKAKKYLEIKEVERTKTNVPDNIRNCFQIHKLTYSKEDGSDILEGNWIPVPDQPGGDCGYGLTSLTRRVLNNSFRNSNSLLIKAPVKKPVTAKKLPALTDKNKSISSSPVTKIPQTKTVTVKKLPDLADKNSKAVIPAIKPPVQRSIVAKKLPEVVPQNKKISPPVVKERPKMQEVKLDPKIQDYKSIESVGIPLAKITTPSTTPKFEKRNRSLIKTIEVENEVIRVDLYDNGEIDGDSISLFYNGKLLLSHSRLSEKAITLNITVDPESDDINELVMYAENLGSIPPNTALMVVTDGANRYEVRITSDLKKSGAIDFIHKQN